MNRKVRLVYLLLSFIVLVCVGRWVTGSFDFMLQQFWFISGLFLLMLLSLIDQPHFSKDANIFVNGTTGWVSLMLVLPDSRDGAWWMFFAWCTCLIIASYILMWIRAKELFQEGRIIQLVTIVNRQIGRPEALRHAILVGKASSSTRPIMFRIQNFEGRWERRGGNSRPAEDNIHA